MNSLKVGDIYPQFRREDGVILTYGQAGLRMIFIMGKPTQGEIHDLKAGSVLNLRMGVLGEHIVMCVKPGKQPWSDCTFAPGLQPNEPYDIEIDTDKGLAMTVELYDGYNGELKALRMVSLPHDFSVHFLMLCRKLLTHQATAEKYYSSLGSIMSRSTKELVNICDIRASIGGEAQ